MTPLVARLRMSSHIWRRLRGSSPVVGSSRKITRGEPISVIARSRRRRIPPEYVDTGLRGRVHEIEPGEQLVDSSAPGDAAEVVQVGHQLQVLLAGQQLVHRRELAGDADRRAHAVRVVDDVVAGHLRVRRSRRE